MVAARLDVGLTALTWHEASACARVYGLAVAAGDRKRATLANDVLARWLDSFPSWAMRETLRCDLLMIAAESTNVNKFTSVQT